MFKNSTGSQHIWKFISQNIGPVLLEGYEPLRSFVFSKLYISSRGFVFSSWLFYLFWRFNNNGLGLIQYVHPTKPTMFLLNAKNSLQITGVAVHYGNAYITTICSFQGSFVLIASALRCSWTWLYVSQYIPSFLPVSLRETHLIPHVVPIDNYAVSHAEEEE